MNWLSSLVTLNYLLTPPLEPGKRIIVSLHVICASAHPAATRQALKSKLPKRIVRPKWGETSCIFTQNSPNTNCENGRNFLRSSPKLPKHNSRKWEKLYCILRSKLPKHNSWKWEKRPALFTKTPQTQSVEMGETSCVLLHFMSKFRRKHNCTGKFSPGSRSQRKHAGTCQ